MGTVGLFPALGSVQTLKLQTREETTSLQQVLKEIGDKYDRYFTIDSTSIGGNTEHSLEGQRVSQPQMHSLTQVLELLRTTIPNLTYKVDRYNSKIIHIIDRRLEQRKGYAMEKIIDNISFDGTLMDLVNTISKKGVAISSQGFLTTTDLFVGDGLTQVRIIEKNRRVRDLLTNYIPLNGRGRILWIAETNMDRNDPTFVRYLR